MTRRACRDGGGRGAFTDGGGRDPGPPRSRSAPLALTGYAADLTPAALAALRRDPRVVAVEADRPVVRTAAIMPVGIDRINADLSVTAGIDGADRPRVD